MLNFVTLANAVQLQQLIFGNWTTEICLNFTFLKSACHKLSGDIIIVLVFRSNQELCFIEYQRNFVPDFANCSLRPYSKEITQELECIESSGFHCCIKKVGSDLISLLLLLCLE